MEFISQADVARKMVWIGLDRCPEVYHISKEHLTVLIDGRRQNKLVRGFVNKRERFCQQKRKVLSTKEKCFVNKRERLCQQK